MCICVSVSVCVVLSLAIPPAACCQIVSHYANFLSAETSVEYRVCVCFIYCM